MGGTSISLSSTVPGFITSEPGFDQRARNRATERQPQAERANCGNLIAAKPAGFLELVTIHS